MIPMIFPYAGVNRPGQQFYVQTMYPNFQPYQLTNGPPHPGNYPIGYNPYYPAYPAGTNFMHPSMSLSNLPSLMAPRPLIPSTPSYSALEPLLNGPGVEKSQSLTIRECQSPTVSSTNDEAKKTLIDQNDGKVNENASTEASPLESEPTARTSSCEDEMESDPSDEEFLTFIKQKDKRKTPTTTTTTMTMPRLDSARHVSSTAEAPPQSKPSDANLSSYRLLFDSLIERTYQSIEATKKLPKKALVDDASVQCDYVHDRIHRSAQTVPMRSNADLLEDQSVRMVKLMEKLVDEFRRAYQADPRSELKPLANICDELHQSTVFMHLAAASTKTKGSIEIPTKVEKPFRDILEESENHFVHIAKYPPSLQRTLVTGRGNRQLMPSTNFSPMPSFSCRSIESSAKTAADKLCLICQKPVDQNEKFLHQWCR